MNPSPLKGRSCLLMADLSTPEIRYLLDLAKEVKHQKRLGLVTQRFQGKTLAMIFEKPSTRTRAAFETAFAEEGGHPVFLSKDDIQLGYKESVEDTARVLGRMFDAIMFRGFKQETVETLSKWSGVPVYNGLTDMAHPTQVLADLLTLEEAWGSLKGRKLVYCGDGRNNMSHTLMVGAARMGMKFVIAAPEPLFPADDDVEFCREIAAQEGTELIITSDMAEAVKGADAIYTDVWASMGEETLLHLRKQILKPYQVNEAVMAATGNPKCVFLHCLPAVKGDEVTEGVFEGAGSRVWDQSENRKHTIKALMLATLA
ncbi:MAG: ornithine carbamoyltransferase [Spirochaetales bacterium]